MEVMDRKSCGGRRCYTTADCSQRKRGADRVVLQGPHGKRCSRCGFRLGWHGNARTWEGGRVETPDVLARVSRIDGRAHRGRSVTARPMPNFLSNLYLAALLAVRPERVTVIR